MREPARLPRHRAAQIVVDFSATWCGPCKMISPFFEELSLKYPNLVFLKVDVDACQGVAAECGIAAMPTFQARNVCDARRQGRRGGASWGEGTDLPSPLVCSPDGGHPHAARPAAARRWRYDGWRRGCAPRVGIPGASAPASSLPSLTCSQLTALCCAGVEERRQAGGVRGRQQDKAGGDDCALRGLKLAFRGRWWTLVSVECGHGARRDP